VHFQPAEGGEFSTDAWDVVGPPLTCLLNPSAGFGAAAFIATAVPAKQAVDRRGDPEVAFELSDRGAEWTLGHVHPLSRRG
jgi:hypothetical protein